MLIYVRRPSIAIDRFNQKNQANLAKIVPS